MTPFLALITPITQPEPPVQPPAVPGAPQHPIWGGPGTIFPGGGGYPPVAGQPLPVPVPPPVQPGAPGSPQHPIWGGPGISFPDKPGYPPVIWVGPIIP